MTISVFVGISIDGFLARRDGTLDFLPEDPGDHGYEAFIATIDAIVMGRNTYDFVLSYPGWHFGKRRIVVLSSRPIPLPAAPEAVVEQMSGEPEAIVAALAAKGAHNLYVDGGLTIQRFLRAGLVDRLILTRVPVLIGQGIPLFGELAKDIRLRHISTRAFDNGLVQSEYQVER